VDTLTPVAKAMWKHNPDHIIIASDLGKQLPRGLAAIGCCLSLHAHIYFVNSECVKDVTGLKVATHWPMEFLPEIWNKNAKLTLESDEGFTAGELFLYYTYYNLKPKVLADGKVVFTPNKKDRFVYDSGNFTVEIPQGTKKLEIYFTDDFDLDALRLTGQVNETVLLTHGIFNNIPTEKKVTILVHQDGSTQNIDNPKKVLDSNYFYEAFLKPFADCAKKYDTTFMMTEIGTDTQTLSPQEYVTYHETWLDALSSHQISWMYNCIHNIFAPIDLMWQNQSAGFTQFITVEGMPYEENVFITDMLRKYQKN
jgi:hypothetical protein